MSLIKICFMKLPFYEILILKKLINYFKKLVTNPTVYYNLVSRDSHPWVSI